MSSCTEILKVKGLIEYQIGIGKIMKEIFQQTPTQNYQRVHHDDLSCTI